MSSTTKPTDRVPSKASDVYLIQGLTEMLNTLAAASMSCAEQHEKLLESHRKLLEERDELRRNVNMLESQLPARDKQTEISAADHQTVKASLGAASRCDDGRLTSIVVGSDETLKALLNVFNSPRSGAADPSSNGDAKVDTNGDDFESQLNVNQLRKTAEVLDAKPSERVVDAAKRVMSMLSEERRKRRADSDGIQSILGAKPGEWPINTASRVVNERDMFRDLVEAATSQVTALVHTGEVLGVPPGEDIPAAARRLMEEHAAMSATLRAHETALAGAMTPEMRKRCKESHQRTESVAGGCAEGAGETAENKTPAPPSTDENHKWTVAERIARAAIAWCRSRKWTDTRAEVEWLRSSQDPSDHKLADLLELVEQSRGRSPRHGAADTNGAHS